MSECRHDLLRRVESGDTFDLIVVCADCNAAFLLDGPMEEVTEQELLEGEGK